MLVYWRYHDSMSGKNWDTGTGGLDSFFSVVEFYSLLPIVWIEEANLLCDRLLEFLFTLFLWFRRWRFRFWRWQNCSGTSFSNRRISRKSTWLDTQLVYHQHTFQFALYVGWTTAAPVPEAFLWSQHLLLCASCDTVNNKQLFVVIT
jgi:hypothetical protein